MDPAGFCTQSRLVIVAGKGGVGKTTVTAALARMASRAGVPSLIVEIEGKSGLAATFGAPPLDYHEAVLVEGTATEAEIRARTLTPDEALVDYLQVHGMKRISKRLVNSGAIDVVSTAVPGIKDILVLGKVKALVRDNPAHLVLVDAPAAGHAVSFLLSARGLVDAARVGPINAQAQEVLELLHDAERCQVLLVTLPEETPVNEVVDTAFALEDRVGVSLGPVVVNGLYPVLDGLDADPVAAAAEAGTTLRPGEVEALRDAAAFRRSRQALQAEQVDRLREALPLAQLHLPFLFTADVGPGELDVLADTFAKEAEGLP